MHQYQERHGGDGGGRQKTRWKDAFKRDTESAGLQKAHALDRATWKNRIQYHSGDRR